MASGATVGAVTYLDRDSGHASSADGTAATALATGSTTQLVSSTGQAPDWEAVTTAVGNAVVRNRTKRRLRALVATRLTSAPDGVDLVIRANPAAASATTTQLERSLDTAWSAALQRLSQPRSRETPRSETPRTRATSAVPQS